MAKVKIEHKAGIFLLESDEILHVNFLSEKLKVFIQYKSPMHGRTELEFVDKDACIAQASKTYTQIHNIDKGHL